MLATDGFMVLFRLIHIVAGVFWVGSLFLFVMFLQPAAADGAHRLEVRFPLGPVHHPGESVGRNPINGLLQIQPCAAQPEEAPRNVTGDHPGEGDRPSHAARRQQDRRVCPVIRCHARQRLFSLSNVGASPATRSVAPAPSGEALVRAGA